MGNPKPEIALYTLQLLQSNLQVLAKETILEIVLVPNIRITGSFCRCNANINVLTEYLTELPAVLGSFQLTVVVGLVPFSIDDVLLCC